MIRMEVGHYGEYTAFLSPQGSFDKFEFPQFVQAAGESGAGIAFCGAIRMLPDGSLNRPYFTDENLYLSGEEAYELMQRERWIPPRFFGMLVRNDYYGDIDVGEKTEEDRVLQLVRSVEKVFVYGGYATYLDSRYDITSIHCEEPLWLSENLTKAVFRKPFVQLPPSGSRPRVWILGTPEHGNLGDHAIVYAMHQFVTRSLPGMDIVEISERQLEEQIDELRSVVLPKELILLVGGGNLGDLYLGPERARRIAIENFPDNRMILFPQSVYFQNLESIKETERLLASHSNLTLCARERFSFDQMKEYFPYNHILLMPDIVLSINLKASAKKRKGAMFLIRLDRESILSQEDLYELRAQISKRFETITFGDTIVRHSCWDSEEELDKKLEQIREAELVITDRLHGAIFAAITGTSCVLLPNHYHKVQGIFEWLKRLPYLRFCRELSQFGTMVDELLTMSFPQLNCDSYAREFVELESLLKGSNINVS
ncbi:hypothetical protein FYJ38_17595 [Clostridium sp. WB02_MRS01]|uniref:polysaccharide pyruvyl transferase family protein n=1 Tax=Clostridium sp. WB02_MRS01 TaxID=2605777 RepID=UPI0012B1AE38|nr:polysaccharide pyruvyl transferase family protein [Clostridium sp. WB02_MRS01]MSS10450.1 hypothetical protein [Clostridium sp. WB02_MRS01]